MRIQSALLIAVAVVSLAGCGAPGAAQRTTGGPVASVSVATEPAATDTVDRASATDEPAATQPSVTEPIPSTLPASTAEADVAATATPTQASTPAPEAAVPGAAAAPNKAPSDSAATGTIRLVLQPDSQVSYRVREQLANVQLPSDAVGTTKAVTGTVVIRPDGQILADQSKFVVDLGTLASDSGMRDNYIRRNTLQTGTYPEAVFVPTAVEGLSTPLPASGDVSFKLVGDLTVRGVTKQVTWDAQGKVAGNDVT
ncbi:MAG: YceI family protein, partial [Nitrososphaerales archaeon]